MTSPLPPRLAGLSSMATRLLLAELAAAWAARSGVAVAIESVGGVDAARRVQAGEHFDLVVLAAEAIDKLIASNHLAAGSRVDLARSPVAVAVRAGAPRPDIGSEDAVRAAVLAARSLSLSTGPSGTYLSKVFERWGIAGQIRGRLVQAPPGVPVGALVARGEAELGFQQLSELMALPGIEVLGTLPSPIEAVTVFSAGLPLQAGPGDRGAAARAFLEFLASADSAEAKRRHGMTPA
ncbi:MAG: substrate-binding domain-containing protein [Burkholderiales bacterium]|nr:substrate-binding domain-containing protein [Burkholderiales bacterium]